MALKVKAVEKKIKFDKNPDNPGVWRYVMSPELYAALFFYSHSMPNCLFPFHGILGPLHSEGGLVASVLGPTKAELGLRHGLISPTGI